LETHGNGDESGSAGREGTDLRASEPGGVPRDVSDKRREARGCSKVQQLPTGCDSGVVFVHADGSGREFESLLLGRFQLAN